MAAAIKWGLEVAGLTQLKRALKALGETDAPFLRSALDQGGHLLGEEAAQRAPRGIAQTVTFAGVKGVGATLRAVVTVKHRGAKAKEFGRTTYYRGFTGRAQKATGEPFKASLGQRADPFMGIKTGGAAIGASRERIAGLSREAVAAEGNRAGSEDGA